VLIQIDPGPEEEKMVAKEAERVPELAGAWQPAPQEYWNSWREECKLADRIVINSEWSREGLVRGGVPGAKMSVVPLAYQIEVESEKSEVRSPRPYPTRFTNERPLRVLFLGLINLGKGGARLLEAARVLRDEPVEFALNFEVNVRWANPIGTGWIGARLHSPEAICTVAARDDFGKADKAFIQRCGIRVIGVGIAAKTVRLPDDDPRTLDRLAGSIENAPLHYDDFALGMARRSIDNSQVICRNRVLNRREVRSKNLVRRMLRRRND